MKDYISGFWHHDRCGRRVKAFLFLHDVAENGRPTLVARGSHRTLYYSYMFMPMSRFSDDYIRESYDAAAMTGAKGGGFIFDTNAAHRGELDGDVPRTVLVAEFIGDAKLEALTEFHYTGPCGAQGKHARATMDLRNVTASRIRRRGRARI